MFSRLYNFNFDTVETKWIMFVMAKFALASLLAFLLHLTDLVKKFRY